MRSRFLQISSVMLLAALLPMSVSARAQRRVVPLPRPRAVSPPVVRIQPPIGQERRMADIPPQWIERLQEMSPQQQERFFRNNERFRGLPAEQKAQIRQSLKAWNSLPAEQRQALLERQQVWQQLTPDQQRQVRETLLPKWQSLPAKRRQAILTKLRELRGLDDSQRAAKLNDESFLDSLNPDDRQMLRDLSSLRVGDAGA
jgi:Protein of unknown function (DUF3106)